MKGTYLLLVRVEKPLEIRVGKKGLKKFPAGDYVYIGSAMNSLEARIARHLRSEKKNFWHIDYLLRHASVLQVWTREGKREECETARKIKGEVVKGFGSSDCRCAGHLFRIGEFSPPAGFHPYKSSG